MIYYHDIFPEKQNRLHGLSTYANDFRRVVLPALKQIDTRGVDIDYFIGSGESLSERNPNRKHIAEWHYNYDFQETILRHWPDNLDAVVVHTRAAEKYFKGLGLPRLHVHFIPMSIDISALPKLPATRNNRWIYLGNLNNDPKRKEFAKIKDTFLGQVDEISYGQFNETAKIHSHDECLKLASNYTYGAAVGRSVMELLGMGIKCLVVGRKYGGPIRNDADLLAHLEHNINSSYYSSSTGNLEYDYAQLVAGGTITPSLIDMSTRISDYVAVVNDILTAY